MLSTTERIPAAPASAQMGGSAIVWTFVNVMSHEPGFRSTNPKTPWRPGFVPVDALAHDTDEIGGSGARADMSVPSRASAGEVAEARPRRSGSGGSSPESRRAR